jgi:hypothetical protein
MASMASTPMANSQQDSYFQQSALHDHSEGGVAEGKEDAPAGRALMGFTVQPGGGSIAPEEFNIAASMKDVKVEIAHKVDCEPHHVVLRLAGTSTPPAEIDNCQVAHALFAGIVVPADRTLHECGVRAGDHVVGNVTVDETQNSHDYVMPRLITVAVKDEATGDVISEIDIEVDRDPNWDSKAYFGGFRHKLSGLVYHHASAQTAGEVKRKFEGAEQKYSRETQTAASQRAAPKPSVRPPPK